MNNYCSLALGIERVKSGQDIQRMDQFWKIDATQLWAKECLSPHPRLCALPLPPLWWATWGDKDGPGATVGTSMGNGVGVPGHVPAMRTRTMAERGSQTRQSGSSLWLRGALPVPGGAELSGVRPPHLSYETAVPGLKGALPEGTLEAPPSAPPPRPPPRSHALRSRPPGLEPWTRANQ